MPAASSPLDVFRAVYASILLAFSITLLMGLIANRQTRLSDEIHPAFAYVMIWVAIGWLTMVEGGQGSLVGLAPVNKELYKDSHPLAYKCTSITNSGETSTDTFWDVSSWLSSSFSA